MPEYQFPQFEIGNAQPQAAVVRHGAYNTLPHQAVQPWRRQCDLQWVSGDVNFTTVNTRTWFFSYTNPSDTVTVINTITHTATVYHSFGAVVIPYVITPYMNGVFAFYSMITGQGIKYIINDRIGWQFDAQASVGTPPTAPTEASTLVVNWKQGADQLSPEGKFNLVVGPNETFAIVLDALLTVTLAQIGFTAGDYLLLAITTDVTGRTMPRSLYDQFVAENGGR